MMTALRPHPIHAPSLRIFLGLDPIPATVIAACKNRDNIVKAKSESLLDSNQLAHKKHALPYKVKKGGCRPFTDDEIAVLRRKILALLDEGVIERKTQYASIEADEETDKKHYFPRNFNDEKMTYVTFQKYASAIRDYYNNPFPSEKEKKVLDSYKQGFTAKQILETFEFSPFFIKTTLIKFGVTSRIKWPVRTYRDQIIGMSKNGAPASEIIAALGCNPSTVYRALNSHNPG